MCINRFKLYNSNTNIMRNYALLLSAIIIITLTMCIICMQNYCEQTPYQYRLELLDEDYVRLMDADGKQIKITTLDSLSYYIIKDNE